MCVAEFGVEAAKLPVAGGRVVPYVEMHLVGVGRVVFEPAAHRQNAAVVIQVALRALERERPGGDVAGRDVQVGFPGAGPFG